MVIDKPEPTFEDLAAAALANADIDTLDCLRAARAAVEAAAAAQVQASNGPRIVKADPGKIVYKITVELPDAGLLPRVIPHALDEPTDLPTNPVAFHAKEDTNTDTSRQYPTWSRRSVVGNQPYNTYAPRMQSLQLGKV